MSSVSYCTVSLDRFLNIMALFRFSIKDSSYDAEKYEVWGVSTIKYDMCHSIYTTDRYGCMAALGRGAMREIVILSTC